MSTVTLAPSAELPPAHGRDAYRFGAGPELRLVPGTHGWSASDLEDPEVYRLFQNGRFEILDGILTETPPANYDGGACADNLKYLLRDHLRAAGVRFSSSSEVDIKVEEKRYLRADAVCVFGEDFIRLEQHAARFGKRDWGQAALVIGPSLIIESVSRGHESHDRELKRGWYAQLGARRYWIVDAFARSLECLVLDGSTFREEDMGRNDEILTVPSLPGLSIPLTQIWPG